MSLHPVLAEKLSAAVAAAPRLEITRRDLVLPTIAGKVHAVVGMRRSGKTTFLRQLVQEKRESVEPQRAVYLGFDDDRLASIDARQLDLLVEEYYRRYPELRGRQTVHWFLDEIQLVDGWERFVRRILDTERAEIVVSGSSARMLSREVHTSLRGRGVATVVRPFSFREFLRHRHEEPVEEPARWTPGERSLVERRFNEYLVQGGFPECQEIPNSLSIEILQGYVDTVLFRDVVERFSISQVAALRWLVRQCLRNPAGLFSVNRLAQDLRSQGHGVAKDAVHAMLGHLVDAFLLGTVAIATDSERKRNSNPRKVYPADPGLIGAFDSSGRSNVGHALETAVYIELERRKAEIGYVKTTSGQEVDFLARWPGRTSELVQVCADLSEDATRTRELRALTDAATEHEGAALRVLVLNRDAWTTSSAPRPAGSSKQVSRPDAIEPRIRIQPAYEWLLER